VTVTTDWAGVVNYLCTTPKITTDTDEAKKAVPLFVPGWFRDGGKTDDYVEGISFAVLDFDKGYDNRALQRLLEQVQGLRCLLYTSFSNRCQPWKFRLVVDLDRNLYPSEYLAFWRGWSSRFDPPPDLTCHNLARGYFLPATPYLHHHRAWAQEGTPLPVDKVIALAPAATTPTLIDPARETSELVTALDISAHGKKLYRSEKEERKQLGSWFKKIADGRPYAEPTTRHNTRLRITMELDKAFPLAHPETLALLLKDSHVEMQDEDFDSDIEHTSTVKQIEGARRKRLARAEQYKAAQLDEQQTAIRELLGRPEPYTDQEVATFAQDQHVSLAAWRSRWAVQHGRSAYLWVGGGYRGPIGLESIMTAAKRWLAPVLARPELGVSLVKTTQAGNLARKTKDDFLAHYATVVTKVSYNLQSTKTKLNAPEDELELAACPHRPWQSQYSARVARWLELLGGDQHADLLRWLRWLRDLSRGHACLYLQGEGGTGKSLFGQALARLWSREGATPAVSVAGNFQDLLLSCPLVFADEHMPPEWSGRTGGARFRDFLGASSHPLNRKGLPAVIIKGYARVIAAANNDSLIQMRESLTKADRRAIQERIFHVEVQDDARKYLESIQKSDPQATSSIINGELAQHVLWIERNLELPRTGRFGVAAQQSRVHDVLKWSQDINAAVGEWLIGFVLDPEHWRSVTSPPAQRWIQFVGGQMLINLRALRTQGNWELYVHNPRAVPPANALARALEEWSIGTQSVNDIDYVIVDLDGLCAFAGHQKTVTEREFKRSSVALFKRAGFEVVNG
jgi:hypothetical protein